MAIFTVPKIRTEVGGAIKEQQMRIENPALVFKILRDSLYSDKIGSVVREYSCNARDAHREVNRSNIPIEITLPSWDKSELIIRDFGPSISPQRMDDVFCSLTASTKRDSNDQLGQYGIGSKSAFSLTDLFNVHSVTNGILRKYCLYIDKSQMGKCDLLSEEKTKLPDGTSIIIAIQKKDIDAVVKAVKKTTQHWDVRPTIKNGNIIYDKFEYIQKNEKWGVYKHTNNDYDDYNNKSSSLMIIDGLQYGIETDKFSEKYQQILRNSFVLIFGVGDISFAASRESVQFDAKTQKSITDRLDLVLREFADVTSKNISSAKTYLDACNKMSQFIGSFKHNGLHQYLNNVKWKNYIVKSPPTIDLINSDIECTCFHSTTRRFKGQRIISTTAAATKDGRSMSAIDNYIKFFYIKGQASELKHSMKTYAESFFNENVNISSIAFVRLPEEIEDPKDATKTIKPVYNLDFLDLLGIKDINTIQIHQAVKTRQTRGSFKTNDTTVAVYSLCPNSYKSTYVINETKEVPNNGGYYVIFDSATRLVSTDTLGNFKDIEVTVIDDILKNVVGVTSVRAKKLSPQWKTVGDGLQEKVDEILKKHSIKEIEGLVLDEAIINHWKLNLPALEKIILKDSKIKSNLFTSDSLVGQLLQNKKDIETKFKEIQPVGRILFQLNKILPSPNKYEKRSDLNLKDWEYERLPLNIRKDAEAKSKHIKLIESIRKIYPMLAVVDARDINTFMQPCIDYINSIDKTTKSA